MALVAVMRPLDTQYTTCMDRDSDISVHIHRDSPLVTVSDMEEKKFSGAMDKEQGALRILLP